MKLHGEAVVTSTTPDKSVTTTVTCHYTHGIRDADMQVTYSTDTSRQRYNGMSFFFLLLLCQVLLMTNLVLSK